MYLSPFVFVQRSVPRICPRFLPIVLVSHNQVGCTRSASSALTREMLFSRWVARPRRAAATRIPPSFLGARCQGAPLAFFYPEGPLLNITRRFFLEVVSHIQTPPFACACSVYVFLFFLPGCCGLAWDFFFFSFPNLGTGLLVTRPTAIIFPLPETAFFSVFVAVPGASPDPVFFVLLGLHKLS